MFLRTVTNIFAILGTYFLVTVPFYLMFCKDLGMLLYEEDLPVRSVGFCHCICKGISDMNRDYVGIQAVISQVRPTEIQ